MIHYNIIASGSSGNAVVIEDTMLIDCGVPFKALQEILHKIKVVFLTHAHGDHFNASTIKRLAFERPALRFAAPPWLTPALIDCGIFPNRIDVIKPDGTWYGYSFADVCAHETHHDVPNVCYKFRMASGERLIYATDTASMDGINAPLYDLYLIEGNYNAVDIQTRIADKKLEGQYIYERRVLKTHLSEQDALDWIFSQAGPASRYELIHKHKEVTQCSIE